MNTGLCIGGPKDGQWLSCEFMKFYVMDTLTPLPLPDYFSDKPAMTSVEVKKVCYVFRFLCNVTIWALEEELPNDIIKRLLTNYHPLGLIEDIAFR